MLIGAYNSQNYFYCETLLDLVPGKETLGVRGKQRGHDSVASSHLTFKTHNKPDPSTGNMDWKGRFKDKLCHQSMDTITPKEDECPLCLRIHGN